MTNISNIMAGPQNLSDQGLTPGETAFYLTTGICGLIFDALILLIASRHVNTNDRPHQIFVINMTIADLLFSIVSILFRPYVGNLIISLCVPYYMIICSSQIASCLFLLWLNVDKLIYIQFPLHYDIMVTRWRVLIATVLTWISILCFSFVIYHFFIHYGSEPRRCDIVEVQPAIAYLPVCIVYVITILISFVISVIIYGIAQNSSQRESRARKKLFRRLFFIFSSTLWTFITCLPYRVLYLFFKICKMMNESRPEDGSENISCFPPVLFTITNIALQILVLGTVVNPIITIVTQRLYRNRLARYFRCCRTRFFGQSNGDNAKSSTVTVSDVRRDSRKSSSMNAIENVRLTEQRSDALLRRMAQQCSSDHLSSDTIEPAKHTNS